MPVATQSPKYHARPEGRLSLCREAAGYSIACSWPLLLIHARHIFVVHFVFLGTTRQICLPVSTEHIHTHAARCGPDVEAAPRLALNYRTTSQSLDWNLYLKWLIPVPTNQHGPRLQYQQTQCNPVLTLMRYKMIQKASN